MSFRPKVLVVEPEKGAREIAVHMLCTLGLDAVACGRTQDAVELALPGRADALLIGEKQAHDIPAFLAVEQSRYAGAITGAACWNSLGSEDAARLKPDARTRFLPRPATVRQIVESVGAVSPRCRRALTAARAAR